MLMSTRHQILLFHRDVRVGESQEFSIDDWVPHPNSANDMVEYAAIETVVFDQPGLVMDGSMLMTVDEGLIMAMDAAAFWDEVLHV
jgi:hypothetical protein